MANCRECIHWDKCSKVDGTTRFYGKEVACDNAEKLCEWFISTTEVAPIADTVRKMCKLLRKKLIPMKDRKYGIDCLAVSVSHIDQIAKEMLEGEK